MTGYGSRARAIHVLQLTGVILAVLIFFLAVLSFVLPLAKAFAPLVREGFPVSGYGIRRLAKITGYTFKEAAASTILALLLGIPAAFLVARRNFPGRRLLASFAAIPLCVPPLIVALGYISSFGMAGYANRLLAPLTGGRSVNILYSFRGLVMAQGFYNFPIIMATVADSWGQLDDAQADSARLLGAGEARCFLSITLIQLLPSIISGAITVFIYCFFSFMFVLLFGSTGGTTLEVAIYHAGRSQMQFTEAAALALLESTVAISALFFMSKAEDASKRLKGLSFRGASTKPRPVAKKEAPLVTTFLLVIAMFFVMPLLSIVISSLTARTGGGRVFSLAAWRQLLAMRSFYLSLRNTLLVAAGTSLLSTTAAVAQSLLLALPPLKSKALFRTIPLLPLAVSSVLMGLGMTMLVRRGHPAQLILAQTALYWPFAFRQVQACMTKIPGNVTDAAAMLSPCRTDGLFRVMMPYCKRGIISGAGFCFAMSCSDATLPLVLSLYKFDTLSLFTYRLAGSYRLPQASASGAVLGLFCTLAFALSNRAKMSKENHGIS
ncbi:MAG: iron ABC transporter permease [Treponema sp.]|nr:iron ABC transporter permease [Treponema sp.]